MALRLSKRQSLIAAAVAVVVIAAGAIAAVASSGGDSTSDSAASSSPPSSAPAPTPTKTKTSTPPEAAPVNPLTGVGAPPKGPVIAVKIDDTGNGRPPVGLNQADIVYIEQVEGGLTRMAAIFGTHKPVVEPVRSVRASDSELLRQYGPIILVASGGGGQSLPTLDGSGMVGVIHDRNGPGFSLDDSRSMPYNLVSDLAQVAATVKGGGSKDVGFRWASSDPRAAAGPVATTINTVVGSTPVGFQWRANLKRYVRTVGGQVLADAAGGPISTPNVLVQFSTVSPDYSDVDVNGAPSQMTASVGSGKVALFRDGHRIDGTWSRASATAATTYKDSRGRPLTLSPGGAYVVLAANGSPV